MRILLAVFPLAAMALLASAQEKKTCDEAECTGYISEKCLCEKHEGDCPSCGCACTGGTDCACVKSVKEKTGVIKGVVKNQNIKKAPAVVYIEEMPGVEFKQSKKISALDQKAKIYIPHLLPVLVGSKVDFMNSDEVEHNTFSPDNEKFDLGNWNKGEKRSYTFKRAGFYTILCSLHPEMVAYVCAIKTPYFAVTDKDGNFRIPNVPPGNWKLKVWHERLKQKALEKTYDAKCEQGKETDVAIEP